MIEGSDVLVVGHREGTLVRGIWMINFRSKEPARWLLNTLRGPEYELGVRSKEPLIWLLNSVCACMDNIGTNPMLRWPWKPGGKKISKISEGDELVPENPVIARTTMHPKPANAANTPEFCPLIVTKIEFKNELN